MEACALVELVGRVAAVDVDGGDRGALEAGVRELRRLRSWVDGREVAFARALKAVSSFPEKTLGEAARVSPREASRTLERAGTVEVAPLFGEALDAGEVSGAHVDVLGRVLRKVTPAVREQIVAQSPRLVAVARQATPDEFARTMERVQRAVEVDADREARLARQRRATRLRTWVDPDGMGRLAGAFDPETFLAIDAALRSTVETLFREQTPPCCPTDGGDRQDFLRAHALAQLVAGGGTRRGGRREAILVIDATNPTPDGRPGIDWGVRGIELPDRCVTEFAATATCSTVAVADGQVITAPGRLNLARTVRVASFDQRRALAGLYATCAIPGCTVGYWTCKLHHVVPWEQGGATDLHNLLPVCERHHHAIHDAGWHLTLDARRRLTVTLPDGEVMTTGPPHRTAA
jgi:hypothetical protein